MKVNEKVFILITIQTKAAHNGPEAAADGGAASPAQARSCARSGARQQCQEPRDVLRPCGAWNPGL